MSERKPYADPALLSRGAQSPTEDMKVAGITLNLSALRPADPLAGVPAAELEAVRDALTDWLGPHGFNIHINMFLDRLQPNRAPQDPTDAV